MRYGLDFDEELRFEKLIHHVAMKIVAFLDDSFASEFDRLSVPFFYALIKFHLDDLAKATPAILIMPCDLDILGADLAPPSFEFGF